MKWIATDINTRSDLIKMLVNHTDSNQYFHESVLVYHVLSNVENDNLTLVWAVVQFNVLSDYRNILTAGKQNYIKCFTIKKFNDKWHFSCDSESAFPSHVNCPLEFLELANYEVNSEWRENVRKYHQNQKLLTNNY